MHTCTVNGLADGTDETMVNDIEPSDSTALLELVRKLTTTINKKLHSYTITQFVQGVCSISIICTSFMYYIRILEKKLVTNCTISYLACRHQKLFL